MDERIVLALDGATNASTAALLAFESGAWRSLAHRTDLDSRGQARVLLRLVDDMLHETGRAPADISAVVAGIGPGTFTGVRIAVATGRALALALSIPIVGVSTLSSLAAQAAGLGGFDAGGEPDLIVPVVDARRGQLFYGLYRRVGAGESGALGGAPPVPLFARTEPFAVCDRDALLRTAAPSGARTSIVGDPGDVGATAEQAGISVLPLQVGAQYLLLGQCALEEPGEGIDGRRLDGWLAGVLLGSGAGFVAWTVGEPGSPESVKPIYVRSPDADIHITKMRDPWADTVRER